MKLPAVFDRYRSDIYAELKSALAEQPASGEPMYDMLRYHLGWEDEQGKPLPGSAGKALRPTLCLLACEATAGDFRKALPAAAALELVHNFSLIHDDIQDNDRERRHRPTVWVVWGVPQAINAGNAMHLVATLALFRLVDREVRADKVLRAQRLLEQSCLTMIEGQYLDLSFESRLDIGESDYLQMIEQKTGALMACSLELGAMLGSDDDLVVQSFRDFGRNLGMAFQVKDDFLGIWGDQQETGKPMGSDIRRGKKSFPVVFALDKAQGEARKSLTNVYRNKSIDETGAIAVMDVLDSLDTRAKVQNKAEQYRDEALAALDKMALSPWARRNLEEVAHFSVARGY
ncbi:MAG: polyprenyl synthetase family protein [Dehalococcoidia bacterium]|nr:polyprenyl synthetase family protein [Dehalococcoidia bacterium]